MGVAIGAFAIGLILYGFAVKLIISMFSNDWVVASMATVGIIYGLGYAFNIIGGFKLIGKGAESIKEIGKALSFFSIGIILYAIAIKSIIGIFKDDYVTASIASTVILLGISGVFAVVGLMSELIKKGASVIKDMGISLIIFSASLILFGTSVKLLMKMFDDDILKAGMVATIIILGMGLVFAGLGFLVQFIAPGAAAIILMGVSLILFSAGLLIFGASIKFLQSIDDIEKFPLIIKGVVFGTAVAFAETGLLAILAIPGAYVSMLMGSALIFISLGLIPFGIAMLIFSKNNLLEKTKEGWEIKGMSALVSMASYFSKIGLYALNPFTLLGVAFSVGMGVSLFSIGTGLKSAAMALKEIPDMSGFIKNLFSEEGLIPSMAESFKFIGKKYSGSFLSGFLGMDDVSLGIRTVKGMSGVLEEIAGGIAAFADFSNFPIKKPNKDGSKLIYGTVDILGDVLPKISLNLPILLTSLATVFADIGKEYGKSFWSGSSSVQDGMDAVKGMGKILSELAGGIVAFSNFEEFPVQVPNPKDPSKLIYKSVSIFDEIIPKIKENIPNLLTALAGVFSGIGILYNGDFISDNYVKKGVDAVKGIGGILSELAGGILAFAELELRGIPTKYDKDGKIIGYTPVNINEIVKVLIGKGLDDKITNGQKVEGLLFTIPKIFAEIGEKYGGDFFNKSSVKKGVDAIKGIGKEMSDIAGGILAFANLHGLPKYNKDGVIIGYDDFNLYKVKQNIIDIIKTIPDIFESVGKDESKYKNAQKNANIIADMMKPVSTIADAISKMFVDKKEKQINLFDNLGTSISNFAKQIEGADIKESQLKMLKGLAESMSKFSEMGDGLNKFADALSKTGTAFNTFAGGFNTFSASLNKFEKFSTSMSTLITNSSKYNFDKFANSMGTLKKYVNDFDVENLKLTDSMLRSVATIAKTPDSLDKISKTLEESLKELAEALKKLSGGTEKEQPEKTSLIQNPIVPKIPGVMTDSQSKKENQAQQILEILSPILKNLNTSISGLNSKLTTSSQGGLYVSLNK